MKIAARRKAFGLCIANAGAEDLEIRKVYRILPDKAGAASGYVRVIDESGEDYLYPAAYFVFVDLPATATRAWAMTVAAHRKKGAPKAKR